jgi:hypothetical protein
MVMTVHATPPTDALKSALTPPQEGSYAVATVSPGYIEARMLIENARGSDTASSPLEGEPNRLLSDWVGGEA